MSGGYNLGEAVVWLCGKEGSCVIWCAKVDPVRLGIDSQVSNAVPCRVVAVVVVVRLRVNSFRRACDLEGGVDHKCDVVV